MLLKAHSYIAPTLMNIGFPISGEIKSELATDQNNAFKNVSSGKKTRGKLKVPVKNEYR